MQLQQTSSRCFAPCHTQSLVPRVQHQQIHHRLRARLQRVRAEQSQDDVGTIERSDDAYEAAMKLEAGLNNVVNAPARLRDSKTSQLVEKRQKELDQRKHYLKNFWYCIALSKNLKKNKPLGVEIMGQKMVLFRDEDGSVRCISDNCPHRGAPLSHGWVDGYDGKKCIVCPYHGWAIDKDGLLRDVPAAERKSDWQNMGAVVPVYPVEEKGGFIWFFNGSAKIPKEERPPIPFTPELEDPSWKAVHGEIEFNCNHWPVFENAIDMAHIHYLHSDSFGNQDKPEIMNMRCTTDPYSVTANFSLVNKPVNPLWAWTQVPQVNVTAKAFLPSTSYISFTLGNGLSFITFVNVVPVSENKTINRFCLVRKLSWDMTGIFNLSAWDKFAERAMIGILKEDRAMVEQLRAEALPREISVRADLVQITFRRLRQSFVDMGYGIDPKEAALDIPDKTGKE